jgi:hypothetical protein
MSHTRTLLIRAHGKAPGNFLEKAADFSESDFHGVLLLRLIALFLPRLAIRERDID